MEHFQAIQPSPLLIPYVKEYWFLTVDDVSKCTQRLMPGGSVALVFNRGGKIYPVEQQMVFKKGYVAGQRTSFTELSWKRLDIVIVILQPAAVKVFLKIPGRELNEINLAIGELPDPELKELEVKVMETKSSNVCVQLIEQFLIKRVSQSSDYMHQRILAGIDAIYSGEENIGKLAYITCWGYKQFKRMFIDYTGINPKDFIRINRFRRVMSYLQVSSGISLNQLAWHCGYYDKSHLLRDFKQFSGYTTSDFLKVCDPYSEQMALFHSLFIEAKMN